MTTQAAWIFFAGLVVYSAILIGVEANTSQEYVRHYFSDIDGGRPFFAINTTLSMTLLASGAVLMIFAAFAQPVSTPLRASLLLWTQAGMLGFLAFDDRVQLHEALAYRLNLGDHFIMAIWALIELVFILVFARRHFIPMSAFVFVSIGAVFFAIMMMFDAILPHDMFLRLSIEDLAKSWAAACFFAASWSLARYHIGLDGCAKTLADWIDCKQGVTGAIIQQFARTSNADIGRNN